MEHQIKIERAPFEPPLFGRFKIYIDGQYRGSAGTKQQAHRNAKDMVCERRMPLPDAGPGEGPASSNP